MTSIEDEQQVKERPCGVEVEDTPTNRLVPSRQQELVVENVLSVSAWSHRIAYHTSLFIHLPGSGRYCITQKHRFSFHKQKPKGLLATDYRVLDNSCTWQYSTNPELLQVGYWYFSATWNWPKMPSSVTLKCPHRVCLFESYLTSQVSAQEINCHPRCSSRFDFVAIEHGSVSIEMAYRTLGVTKVSPYG